MQIRFRLVALSMTLMAMPNASAKSAGVAYNAPNFDVGRADADKDGKSGLIKSQNERQYFRNPYALIDLSNGLLPDDVPRNMLLEDATSCRKTIALLKKQAKSSRNARRVRSGYRSMLLIASS